jgi:hypothetical protein
VLMSVARRSLQFASLFEAELLIELMLRFWQHPFSDDADYRNDLLEKATEVLQHAVNGGQLLETLPAELTNFVAAVWYAEWVAMSGSAAEDPPDIQANRSRWLEDIRRAVPSCFAQDVA